MWHVYVMYVYTCICVCVVLFSFYINILCVSISVINWRWKCIYTSCVGMDAEYGCGFVRVTTTQTTAYGVKHCVNAYINVNALCLSFVSHVCVTHLSKLMSSLPVLSLQRIMSGCSSLLRYCPSRFWLHSLKFFLTISSNSWTIWPLAKTTCLWLYESGMKWAFWSNWRGRKWDKGGRSQERSSRRRVHLKPWILSV